MDAIPADSLPVLDVQEDTQFLHRMLDTLGILNQFKTTFDADQAVCQAQIKALVEECEISLDQRHPLKSYTERPSSHGLQAATESVVSRAGQLLLDLIKKVGELLLKMLRWLKAAVKGLYSRSRFTRQRVVVMTKLTEANAEIKPVAQAVPTDGEATKKAQVSLASAEKNYRAAYNGLAAALLTESPFVGLMKSVGLTVPELVKLVDFKVNLAERALAATHADPLNVAQQLATVAKPMDLGPLVRVLTGNPAFEHVQSMLDAMETLKSTVHRMHESLPAEAMDVEVASKVVIDPRSGFAEPVVAIPDMIDHACDALTTRITTMMHQQLPPNLGHSLSSSVDKAMMGLVTDVHALTLYVESANLLLDAQAGVADALYRYQVAQFEVYRALGKESGNPSLIEELNRVQRKLSETILKR